VVGIVDRPARSGGLVGVTKTTEVHQLLGPGTVASTPEIGHALANGASEVVISAVAGGRSASAQLLNVNAEEVLRLRARSPGASGNALRAEVRTLTNAANEIVRVTIRLIRVGRVLETFSDLQVAPGQPDDLFEAINSQSSLVIAVDPGFADVTPRLGTYAFADTPSLDIAEPLPGTRVLMRMTPAPDADPTGLSVQISQGENATVNVRVFQRGLQEEFLGLVMDPDGDRHLPAVMAAESRLVRFTSLSSRTTNRLPAATAQPIEFTNGESPTVAQYTEAIDRLSDDPRIDIVLASVEAGRADVDVRQIHQALVAHAVAMAEQAAPRIAFGSITVAERNDRTLAQIREHSALVRNRRFVLVAPPGAEGAVAGLVGRLNPQESPTFKPVPLFGITPARFRESELNRLLGSTTNLLVVQERVGRGVVVLRGLDTSGDQISVTRVADIAIRETKAISENFIGQLNSAEARLALKQQIVATFTRMEREGSLVPSTDGKDPAFTVDVYSTQLDFAQGIVRIDIAIRPVRSIDYIYATIRVKN
jgi:hypothetical protein